ncbi:MAG: tryptophan halogenase family protein [Pseudomonadota bacterium]
MSAPRRIIIVGGGTAGWMAANLFVKQWAEDVVITLVESAQIGTVGVGEGSTPTLRRFFELIDVPERDWMPACHATYKTGIRFDQWTGNDNYRHPFFSQPDTFAHRAFFTNCRTRRLGLDVHTLPDDFFLNGQLARQSLAPIAPAHFPFQIEYGYHFDAGKLGAFLASTATARGVEHVQATIERVVQHPTGELASLVTSSGEVLEADFFVDCTGFAGVLLQKTLGVEFLSFADSLHNDAAVALPGPTTQPVACETVALAMPHGWCWQIPLTHRTGFGYVYSSDCVSADEAEQALRDVAGVHDASAKHLNMRVGQVAKHWHRNCLALGLAQGFLEPLEATALLLVQVTIERFMQTVQHDDWSATSQDAFNEEMRTRFNGVRDYIVAHYKLNTRTDTDYWRRVREDSLVSPALQDVLHAWFQREDISPVVEQHYATSHFGTLSWHCLLAGYRAFPGLADNQPGRGDLFEDQRLQTFMSGCAMNFEPHADALTALS